MPLRSGSRLGPYEILSPIGAGGMGEVYKASDTRLDRIVAIKVLPEHLAESPERKQRFEREAKAISQLNHPHICTLYDVGRQDGVDYLVMEHIEGETLSERLKKGALPLDKALEYGIQIADGLNTAHRAGIVHRDLKPGNMMLTKSGVKLLDFGLAKLVEEQAAASGASSAPTQQKDLTSDKAIIGTLQYMAPEQLEAGDVDARTDIFALGLVLYEMVTGQNAFQGKSQASLIAAILEHVPSPISEHQPVAPPLLDRVVGSCLAKDPDERWQSAADVRRQLEWVATGVPDSSAEATNKIVSSRSAFLGWAVAGLLLLGFLTLSYFQSEPQDEAVTRFFIEPPEAVAPTSALELALSPDGRHLAIAALDQSATRRLWIRSLDTLEAREVPGTEGARAPVWSSDGRHIGFFADRKLKTVDLQGGTPQSLADVPDAGRRILGGAATWSSSGDVLVVTERHSLHLVPASGGEPRPIVTLDEVRDSIWHPEFLPDGRQFLYTVTTDSGRSDIYVGSLDSDLRQHVVSARSKAVYSPPGYLLFVRESFLMAQPFDAETAALSGVPRAVAKLSPRRGVRAGFTVSRHGTLSYADQSPSRLVWFDREGRELETAAPEGYYSHIELSPDDEWVAVDVSGSTVRLVELSRGVVSRLTFDSSSRDWIPAWSPDGRRVAYVSGRTGRDVRVYQNSSSGDGVEELLLESEADIHHTHWSPDGQSIIYERFKGGQFDLWVLPTSEGSEPWPYLESEFSEEEPQFSPDGRWMAYASAESGRLELFVRSFPEAAGKRQVSTNGGDQPRWRADGKELFYLALDGTLMAVPTDGTGNTFETGSARPLFQTGISPRAGGYRGYDVTGDGERFLLRVRETAASVTVVLNWTAELEN